MTTREPLVVDTSSDESGTKNKKRDFICPCGKSYLSYPALFTHIKQKHDGNAPGKVIKPPSVHGKRGRPPLLSKGKKPVRRPTVYYKKPPPPNSFENNNQDQKLSTAQTSLLRSKIALEPRQVSNPQKDSAVRQAINFFVSNFDLVPQSQTIRQSIWVQMKAFELFQLYLNSVKGLAGYRTDQTRTSIDQAFGPKKFKYFGVCIGQGLRMFFHELHKKQIDGGRFSQILLLMTLFLQYVIDENNNESIIEEAPVESLAQYLNQFILDFADEQIQNLGIGYLYIMHKQNMIMALDSFFKWAWGRGLSNYRVTLRDDNTSHSSGNTDSNRQKQPEMNPVSCLLPVQL